MSTLRRFELLLALAAAFAAITSPARADEDALAPYRDRFRQGMDKYKAGAMGEAIRAWTAIYEEIGPQRGYRLSFDLARAYEANFETSRAAERYQSFLDEVAVRRNAGEALDALVEREAREAQSRLDELDATNGRIRIVSGGRTVLTQIDGSDPRLGSFVSYVAPGDHVVVFAPGSTDQERHDVSVKGGELVLVSPSPRELPAPVLVAPAPTPPPVLPPRRAPGSLDPLEIQRPFSPVVIYVSAGATAASLIAPILTYAHALSLINSYYAGTTQLDQKPGIATEYNAARSTAYATLAIPIALSAVTGAFVVYYFRGSKEREVTIGASALPGGGAGYLQGSF